MTAQEKMLCDAMHSLGYVQGMIKVMNEIDLHEDNMNVCVGIIDDFLDKTMHSIFDHSDDK